MNAPSFVLVLAHGSHKFIDVIPPFSSTYRFQESLHLSQMELGFLLSAFITPPTTHTL